MPGGLSPFTKPARTLSVGLGEPVSVRMAWGLPFTVDSKRRQVPWTPWEGRLEAIALGFGGSGLGHGPSSSWPQCLTQELTTGASVGSGGFPSCPRDVVQTPWARVLTVVDGRWPRPVFLEVSASC